MRKYRENPVIRHLHNYIAYTKRHYSKKDKCEFCNSKKDLQVHHIDYVNPFNLMTLCRGCHIKEHKITT